MQPLTDRFMLYRECVRMTWNLFLRNYDDGEHDLADVDAALFSALVESECEIIEPRVALGKEKYYRHLRLSARESSPKFHVLVVHLEEGTRVWTEKELNLNFVDLRYSELFDFATLYGEFRDFRYVYAVVVGSNTLDVPVGVPLLIEANAIDLTDISSSGTS